MQIISEPPTSLNIFLTNHSNRPTLQCTYSQNHTFIGGVLAKGAARARSARSQQSTRPITSLRCRPRAYIEKYLPPSPALSLAHRCSSVAWSTPRRSGRQTALVIGAPAALSRGARREPRHRPGGARPGLRQRSHSCPDIEGRRRLAIPLHRLGGQSETGG